MGYLHKDNDVLVRWLASGHIVLFWQNLYGHIRKGYWCVDGAVVDEQQDFLSLKKHFVCYSAN